MADQKKFLDAEGVKYLWSKINMQDYPNNETLMDVIEAIDETKADKTDVEALYKKLNSDTLLGFYCVEDVTVVVNGIPTIYPANSNVEIKLANDDVFEIIPTSDKSILSLTAFPGALGTFYPWLEGVMQFSNILFDMNDVDMYAEGNGLFTLSRWNLGVGMIVGIELGCGLQFNVNYKYGMFNSNLSNSGNLVENTAAIGLGYRF